MAFYDRWLKPPAHIQNLIYQVGGYLLSVSAFQRTLCIRHPFQRVAFLERTVKIGGDPLNPQKSLSTLCLGNTIAE